VRLAPSCALRPALSDPALPSQASLVPSPCLSVSRRGGRLGARGLRRGLSAPDTQVSASLQSPVTGSGVSPAWTPRVKRRCMLMDTPVSVDSVLSSIHRGCIRVRSFDTETEVSVHVSILVDAVLF
jgi:hypothetical protein